MTLDTICRVCLHEPFASEEIVVLSADQIQKLNFIGDPTELIISDDYPVCLCMRCAETLDWIHNFVLKFNSSKLKFSQYVIKKEEAVSNGEDIPHRIIPSSPSHYSSWESLPNDDEFEYEHTDICSVQLVTEQPNYKIEANVEPRPKPKIGPKSKMKEKAKLERKLKSLKSKSKNYPLKRVEIKSEFGVQPMPTSKMKKVPKSPHTKKANAWSINVAPGVIKIKSEFDGMSQEMDETKPPMPAIDEFANESSTDTGTECYICSKEFSTRANMLRHVREHLGRRFLCEYDSCKAYFTQRSSLQVHMARHEGHKPFECEMCVKKFSQSKSLVFHIPVHTGESPFECYYCQRTFKQKSNLIRHFKSRQKARPMRQKRFECQRCSKFLASKQSLIRHMNLHESIDASQETSEQALKIEKNLFL